MVNSRRFVKHGFVKGVFVKHGFVKGVFVKHGFVKGGFLKREFVPPAPVPGGKGYSFQWTR